MIKDNKPLIAKAHPNRGVPGDIHFYYPAGDGPFPFVLAIHGGAWKRGDQSSYAWQASRLTAAGFAVAICSYRLAPKHLFPAAYDDVMESWHWLMTHGHAWKLDVTRMALLGGSSGGHLVCLAATRGTLEHPAWAQPRAAIAFCPITDLVGQYAADGQSGSTMTADFLGGTPAERSDAYRAASPVAYVHANMPPILLTHGSADPVVPAEQSAILETAIRHAGGQVERLLAEGRKHTMVNDDTATKESKTLLFEKRILEFLHTHLTRT